MDNEFNRVGRLFRHRLFDVYRERLSADSFRIYYAARRFRLPEASVSAAAVTRRQAIDVSSLNYNSVFKFAVK